MSKKSKNKAKLKRRSEKAARKAGQRARYESYIKAGTNIKSKRAQRQGKKKTARASNHPDGECGNPGCIKCHGIEKTEKGVNLIHDGQYWPRSYKALHKYGDHRLGDKGYMQGGSGEPRNISRPRRFFAYSNKTAHRLVKGHGKIYKEDRESYMRIIEWLDLNAQGYGDMFPGRLEDRKIDPKALKDLRAYAKQLFGDKIASQPDRALVNVAQPDESRILMAPLALEAGGWGQIKGWKSKP